MALVKFCWLIRLWLTFGLKSEVPVYAYSRQPYNVLLIIADDLRADIGGWYHDDDSDLNISYTPNIDAFQKESVSFTRAYVQIALCI